MEGLFIMMFVGFLIVFTGLGAWALAEFICAIKRCSIAYRRDSITRMVALQLQQKDNLRVNQSERDWMIKDYDEENKSNTDYNVNKSNAEINTDASLISKNMDI